MAAKFKMATETKTTKYLFSKKNSGLFHLPKYLSFIEKKKMVQHGDFFCHLLLGAFIFVRNFKMVKFLHILIEQTPKFKKLLPKN
jgi:hypothetical protein